MPAAMPCARRLVSVPMLALTLAALAALPLRADEQSPARKVLVPAELARVDFSAWSKPQFDALDSLSADYFFSFRDRSAESGITFRNRVVDDGGKNYRAVHYDHGNGVAAADVDGDGLHDLYFTNQLGANELWRNIGGGRFEDITEKAGVGLADRISVAASFADIDNDGDPDLFVTTVKMGNVLFENDGRGAFTDITAAAGVAQTAHSSGSVFFDYDKDGLLDLLVTNVGVYSTDRVGAGGYFVGVDQAFSGHLFPERTETSVLYRNLGARRFADVSREVGFVDGSWSGDAAIADLDGNGYPDIYLLNMQGDDHLYLNEEGKRFADRTVDYFPKTPWGAMGADFFDWDNDGRQDLLLTDMHSDMSEKVGPERERLKSRMQWSEEQLAGSENNIFGNAFFHNRGEAGFEEISDRVGAENYWPWGFSVGDVNADGFEDVFIAASMNYPFRYGVNSLLLNDGGRRFVDVAFVVGVEPRKDEAVSQHWFDLDCGGADSEHQLCEGEDGRLAVHGALGSRSSVIFDLDRDGDLDIVTNEFNGRPLVLMSDLAAQGPKRIFEVVLVGRRSNRGGLGARVTATAGDLVLTRVHDGKSGYLSQSSLPLAFGLGTAAGADRIEVEWPSGVRQVVVGDPLLASPLVIEEETTGEPAPGKATAPSPL